MSTKRLLITAGPTHEPIDAVRYIGNRSSGRLGCALADAAASSGWEITLLLGPTNITPTNTDARVIRYSSTSDLEALLREHLPACDVLVMAAAVADYRPRQDEVDTDGKRRRSGEMVLHLEATPDLLAGCAERRGPGQMLVGFALEPAERLESSARAKLDRKNIDLIVANPLETMDAGEIEAVLYGIEGTGCEGGRPTPGTMSKADFAPWLLQQIDTVRDALLAHGASARA